MSRPTRRGKELTALAVALLSLASPLARAGGPSVTNITAANAHRPVTASAASNHLLNLGLGASNGASLAIRKALAPSLGTRDRLPDAPSESDSSAIGGSVAGAFAIRWQNNNAAVSPQVVHMVRNFRHDGLPLLRLWQSQKGVLAVGLNPRGVPGVYFTHRVPE
jgi:hypothetical protein